MEGHACIDSQRGHCYHAERMKFKIINGEFYFWSEALDIWVHKEVPPVHELDNDGNPIVHEDLINDYDRAMKGI